MSILELKRRLIARASRRRGRSDILNPLWLITLEFVHHFILKTHTKCNYHTGYKHVQAIKFEKNDYF